MHINTLAQILGKMHPHFAKALQIPQSHIHSKSKTSSSSSGPQSAAASAAAPAAPATASGCGTPLLKAPLWFRMLMLFRRLLTVAFDEPLSVTAGLSPAPRAASLPPSLVPRVRACARYARTLAGGLPYTCRGNS